MANENPTDDSHAVVLTIPSSNVSFLRSVVTAARDGLREDLDDFAGRLQEPESHLRAELAAYGQMLRALNGVPVNSGPTLLDTLTDLAETIDEGNEYARVVTEHDAIHGLLAQVRGGNPDAL